MSEKKTTVEGVDGEKWNSWLVSDKKEILDIKKPKLQTHLRLLARRDDGMNTPDYLQEVHTNLEKMIIDGEIDLEEAGPWMVKIEDRHQALIEEGNNKIPIVKTMFPERQPSLREQPLHIKAVFEGGRNQFYVDDPESISVLDLKNKDDRQKFILRNLYAYNNLFITGSGMSASWLSVVKNWESDIDVADTKRHISTQEMQEFKKDLRAMMAVTASARAMESSAGSATDYLVALTGGERGNTGWQDTNSLYLLHADPSKLNRVIDNPLVSPFYKQLMKDAGLKDDKFHEWREFRDPDSDMDMVIQTPSVVELSIQAKSIRETSDLIKYLRGNAILGGFDGYIKNVLLKDIPPKSEDYETKMAAARLACDAFLVDKYTRWDDLVTEGGKHSLSLGLQPMEQWGGDPFKSILNPTFLPRLKRVYVGEDAVVLDLVDSVFRPEDIYKTLAEKHHKGYGVMLDPRTRLITPSAVTNIKTYARYNTALDRFIGGPMATGIPSWTPKMMNEELPQVADLIAQVYGGQTLFPPKKEDGTKRPPFPVGKHIAGTIMMRALYAKALAATLETAKPGFMDKMEEIFAPENKTRPFLDVMGYLYGPKRDNSSGFIKSLVGGRLRFEIKNNMFDAEKYYELTRKLIVTNDQTGLTNEHVIDVTGFIADAVSSIGRGTGVIRR
jgi:hypothetical protein